LGAGKGIDMKYSKERKEAILRKMLPPENKSISEIAQEEGIATSTLYNWRNASRLKGTLLPDSEKNPEGWSTQDKFAAVIETAAMNEAELAEYCRKRGIYPAQIQAWRSACEQANDWDNASQKKLRDSVKDERKRAKTLERELIRKDRALAEAAALLVLTKKVQAIWGEDEDE
jgi:transposase-like protein